MVSSLSLVPCVRVGAGDPRSRRGGRSERNFLDFVVDERHVGAVLARARVAAQPGGATEPGEFEEVPSDWVSVLVTDWPGGVDDHQLNCLLGREPSTLDDARVPLYVCPECGDLACGALTAVIQFNSSSVVWSDFAYQTDYDALDEDDRIVGIGPFVFDRQAYEAVLEGFRSQALATATARVISDREQVRPTRRWLRAWRSDR